MDDRRKNYRAWDAQQSSQEAISPRDALPEDDLVFFLLDLIPQIDLSPFHDHYAHETARPTAFRCDHDGDAVGLRLLRGRLLQP